MKKRRHLFVVRCRRCGETFIFERPRRRLGWIKTPAGHGPKSPCGGLRHFEILHKAERLEVLRARGWA